MEQTFLEKDRYITRVSFVTKSSMSRGAKRTLSSPPRESHAFIFVLSGEAKYFTDTGRNFTAKENEILYLAKNQLYRIEVQSDDYSYIYFNFSLSSDEDGDKLKSGVFKSRNPKTKNDFTSLLSVYNKTTPIKTASLLSIANDIYLKILEETVEYAQSAQKNKMAKIAEKVRAAISDSSFTVKKLANELNENEVYLRRLFKKTYGLTITDYLRTLRFEKAVKMLETNEHSVTEIARECGFENLYYFSRAYKLRYGHSPTK